jgi:hypothetical protein
LIIFDAPFAHRERPRFGLKKTQAYSALFKIRFAEASDFTTDMDFFQPQLAEKNSGLRRKITADVDNHVRRIEHKNVVRTPRSLPTAVRTD